MTVFNHDNKTGIQSSQFFFGDAPSIARYDVQPFPQFGILNEKMLSLFWRPQEYNLSKDIKDYRELTDHEKHIFTSNLKRQILLDSVQGRAPVAAFLPIVSDPALENCVMTWTFFETIHSQSYTHIIRNVYSDPSVIFDDILDIQEIVDCAKDISKYYDDLIDSNNMQHRQNKFNDTTYSSYLHKKRLWLALNAVNALEGVRFYVSFACSYSFAELKKMEGNAKIIKKINTDENLHLSLTQKLINMLPEVDKDFVKIKEESAQEVKKMFEDVVEQEKAWADYLFKDGSMVGLNADILKQFVEFIARKRMKYIGIECDYKTTQNPLPWVDKWIAGGDVQVAPQQTEIESYLVSSVTDNLTTNSFDDIEL